MITTLLIFFYRWIWECPPLADADKCALVAVSLMTTLIEMWWIGYCIATKKK